jgi:uncharacterized protein (TIGR03435 family)
MLHAQANRDITGQWQGTIQPPNNNKALRLIIVISKGDKGLAVRMYSIDQGAQGFNGQSVTLDGSTVKIDMSIINGTFTGTLAADGNSIAGTWTQGASMPLTLLRTTKDTAWEIPAPPPPPKLMDPNADPSFEVATIKPNNSNASSMQRLTIGGRTFTVTAGSLADLISFAYGIQPKQIINGPDWIDSDRYDISATIQPEGQPNPEQVRVMIRKLLAERFALKLHDDKRDMSAYVISIGKNGQKLTPTQLNGPLPGFGMSPTPGGVKLMARNAAFSEFRDFLQNLVLDRPVVDHTGITGKYDFQVTFTPDDSQFHGHPPKAPSSADSGAPAAEPAPDLIQAFEQQLGLKLSAEKTAVDVKAIDHVEKPSAN